MAAAPWRPGSRLKRLRESHSYRYVLALIVVTYLVIVAAPDDNASRGALVLIESATLAIALWSSGLARLRTTLVVMVVGVSMAVVEAAVGGSTVTGLVALTTVALVAATMAVIGLGVFDQRDINPQAVTGAVCIYLFLGILFTFAYAAVAALGSGAFFAQGTDGTPAIRIYFSYVTLATLGYGDYTPAGQPGRSLAIAEALLGQLYLVTVVALLVGRLGTTRESA
jgi:Ion channel